MKIADNDKYKVLVRTLKDTVLVYVDSVGCVFIAVWCEMPELYGCIMEARSELS